MYKETEQNVYRVPTEWSLKLAICFSYMKCINYTKPIQLAT